MEIHRSARRHGVSDVDIRHATEHPLAVADVDPDADPPKVLVIGADRAGKLLEVIVLELAPGASSRSTPCRCGVRCSTSCLAERSLMPEEPKTYTTKTGRILTDAEIEALADEVEQGYDVEELKRRRRGRPLLGSAPAEVVPVRLDPELRRAAEARAHTDHITLSDVIRQALRRFLDVA